MNVNSRIALGSLVVSGVLLVAGHNVEYGQDAYRFPNAMAWIIAFFSLVMLLTEARKADKSVRTSGYVYSWLLKEKVKGEKKRIINFPRLASMFIIIFLYLFLADTLGLYVTSLLAFFSIVTIYGTGKFKVNNVLRYLLIAVLFITAIYLLFAVGMRLQTPDAVLM